nr:uncharacterized protein LOC4342726 [Oryza sativa Japonica Group]
MHQAPVVDMAETSVPNLGMKPKISERTSNTKATMGTRMNPYGCCRHARCPPVRCHAADKRAGAAIRMNISCCSYNTCEDSTIKCTMTQFEDQFSTIKPDGIQVRCRKVLVLFCTGLRTTLSVSINETAANVF